MERTLRSLAHTCDRPMRLASITLVKTIKNIAKITFLSDANLVYSVVDISVDFLLFLLFKTEFSRQFLRRLFLKRLFLFPKKHIGKIRDVLPGLE